MRPLLFSGNEIVVPALPDDARLLAPPEIKPGLEGVRTAVASALEHPVDGQPLAERVADRAKVLLVFDNPAFPIPPLRSDPRVAAIEAIVACLSKRGVPLDHLSLLCASGVTRLYRNIEIARIAGVPALASHAASCHDAEAMDHLAVINATLQGEPIELNAALLRADLIITLAVAQAPSQGGWTTLVPGLASVATARLFLSAKNLAEGPTPFVAESPFQKALARAGEALGHKLNLFHVELGLDTRLRRKRALHVLGNGADVPRSVAAWNRIPEPIRARAARLFMSDYQTLGVAAGSVEGAHRAIAALLRERTFVEAPEQADIVVLGVPSVAPYTSTSFGNPVLTVASAFGHVLAWHTGRPLVKDGGTVVLLAPLHERFAQPLHSPFAEFYEQVLPRTREPAAMAESFEGTFAGRPGFIAAYRRGFAFHGLLPFHLWYQAWNVLSKVGKVLVVGAAPAAAKRFGFEAAPSLEAALASAREHVGRPNPMLAVPLLPPAFGISVAG